MLQSSTAGNQDGKSSYPVLVSSKIACYLRHRLTFLTECLPNRYLEVRVLISVFSLVD